MIDYLLLSQPDFLYWYFVAIIIILIIIIIKKLNSVRAYLIPKRGENVSARTTYYTIS